MGLNDIIFNPEEVGKDRFKSRALKEIKENIGNSEKKHFNTKEEERDFHRQLKEVSDNHSHVTKKEMLGILAKKMSKSQAQKIVGLLSRKPEQNSRVQDIRERFHKKEQNNPAVQTNAGAGGIGTHPQNSSSSRFSMPSSHFSGIKR